MQMTLCCWLRMKSMVDTLTEIGRYYGMEMNVERIRQ
jgi:hypothetical protein